DRVRPVGKLPTPLAWRADRPGDVIGVSPVPPAGQDGAGQDGAGQDGAGQDGAGQDGAGQDGERGAEWFGLTGPDQGYALHLAERFHQLLVLAPGDSAEDAVAGCLGVALRRASAFDRAPVIFDLELAFTLWGFLAAEPADLVAWRRPLFSSAAHDYWVQREIAARVLPETLCLTPAQVRERLSAWRQMVDATKR
ncbi:MAG: hypothetical protein ACRDX8_05870, partial [Acidimicrobiales bacterium]